MNNRKQDLEYRIASLKSPLDEVTEDMVLDFLAVNKRVLDEDDDPIKIKNLMDTYLHEVIVTDDNIEVILKISLCADKNGVGGPTLLYPHVPK